VLPTPELSTAIYSLIGTAKLNALDPGSYLRHVLTDIVDSPITQITELLPWNAAAASLSPGK
jgi:hypothetical protein